MRKQSGCKMTECPIVPLSHVPKAWYRGDKGVFELHDYILVYIYILI